MGMPCLVLPYCQRSILQALANVPMLYLWVSVSFNSHFMVPAHLPDHTLEMCSLPTPARIWPAFTLGGGYMARSHPERFSLTSTTKLSSVVSCLMSFSVYFTPTPSHYAPVLCSKHPRSFRRTIRRRIGLRTYFNSAWSYTECVLERRFDPTMLISILSFKDLRWCSPQTPPFQSLTGSRIWSLWVENAASRKRKDFHSHTTSNCAEPR